MTPISLRCAVCLVRAWTRGYTWRLDAMTRDARLAEIESDLWEFQNDPIGSGSLRPAMHILARLALGIPADLGWRLELAVLEDARFLQPRAVLVTGMLILIAALAWLSRATSSDWPRVGACGAAYSKSAGTAAPTAPARMLGQMVQQSVRNTTGLIGYFDGEFEPTTELGPPPPPPGIPDPFERASFPSVFAVLPDELGLKLEARRGPVDVLVVDAADHPTDD